MMLATFLQAAVGAAFGNAGIALGHLWIIGHEAELACRQIGIGQQIKRIIYILIVIA